MQGACGEKIAVEVPKELRNFMADVESGYSGFMG